jgi:hypothetical protein
VADKRIVEITSVPRLEYRPDDRPPARGGANHFRGLYSSRLRRGGGAAGWHAAISKLGNTVDSTAGQYGSLRHQFLS